MQTAAELEGRSMDWLGKLKEAGELQWLHTFERNCCLDSALSRFRQRTKTK
jgi:hypothetical protein